MDQRPISRHANATAEAVYRRFRADVAKVLNSTRSEPIHRLRVDIRRLRVLLSLNLHDAIDARVQRHANRELQWLAHALAPVRDTDVFLREVWPSLRTKLGDRATVTKLQTRWRAQRHAQAAYARSELRALRCSKLLASLEAMLRLMPSKAKSFKKTELRDSKDAYQTACDEIARKMKQIRRRHEGIVDADSRALHRLRISVRKLRYLLEFSAPLFKGDRVDRMLKRLARLQNLLGAMNDVAVARTRVDTALKRYRRNDAQQLRESLAAWHAAKIRRLMPQFRHAWRDYAKGKTPW